MIQILKNLFNTSSSNTNNAELIDVIKKGAILVDVRTPGEFSSGSVKGAINIPLDKIGAQQTKLNKQKPIVVFCRSGARSAQAKTILQQSGMAHVINGGTWLQVNQIVNNLS